MGSIRSLLLLVAVAFTASAGPITWTLDGVTSLGTTITGSFIFDADTSTYSSIDIITSGGASIPTTTWTVSDECCSSFDYFLGVTDTSALDQTGADTLGLGFDGVLTNAGGMLNVFDTQEGICNVSDCDTFNAYPGNPGGFNDDVTGSVVAVSSTPDPPSSALFSIGALLFVLMRKRWNSDSIGV